MPKKCSKRFAYLKVIVDMGLDPWSPSSNHNHITLCYKNTCSSLSNTIMWVIHYTTFHHIQSHKHKGSNQLGGDCVKRNHEPDKKVMDAIRNIAVKNDYRNYSKDITVVYTTTPLWLYSSHATIKWIKCCRYPTDLSSPQQIDLFGPPHNKQ